MLISPSILAADFANLGRDIQTINGCADLVHLDIMDGTFVPNISFGFPVVKAVASVATIPLDVHLMVVHPERWFETLSALGASMVSFHLEAAGENTQQCIDQLHSLGIKAGVAINPDVPAESLKPYVGSADFFLIMSVFAGFGGQKFIPETLDRIAQVSKFLSAACSDALIEVDGGVGPQNAAQLRESGAGILVAGSSVFGKPDVEEAIRLLKV